MGEQNNYTNYHGMVNTVTAGMVKLDGVCRHLAMDAQAQEIEEFGDRLRNHVFSVGIMGEFRRGKSTVINALLGQEIVPSDIVPCSATLNYVRWDANKRAEIHFKDGTSKEVPVEELSQYVTKITKESEAMAANVEDAVVFYPCPFCQNGVQIVDTPGLNDDERMTKISENVIPTLDAIVMVIVPDSPFSQSEAEFVRSKVMASDLGRIIFVVNKIDTIDEEDRPRLLESIKAKIQDSVLGKMSAVYGEDSEEFKNAKNKIGDIKLLPISARKALRGKTRNDMSMLAESGYKEFEELLSKLLTEQRGMLELIHPVNQMISLSKEISKNIDTRLNAMRLDAAEFEKIQIESIEKIKETREKKKDEITVWKAQGKTTYVDLLPEAAAVYNEIDNALCNYINEYEIFDSDLQSEDSVRNLSEAISQSMTRQMEDILSINMERLIEKIKCRLGSDIEKLEAFGREFNSNMESIHMEIAGKATSGGLIKSTLTSALIDVSAIFITGGLPGVGALISGFKDHGVKGAVVGGLSGAAIGLAAATAAVSLGVLGLPLLLIAGASSSAGGKVISNLVFGNKQKQITTIDSVRNNMYDSVHNVVDGMRNDRLVESWLENNCENAYRDIAANIDREWENTLKTMEETLTQLQIDLKMKSADKENLEADMKEYFATVSSVLESLSPIHAKLTEVLKEY